MTNERRPARGPIYCNWRKSVIRKELESFFLEMYMGCLGFLPSMAKNITIFQKNPQTHQRPHTKQTNTPSHTQKLITLLFSVTLVVLR